MSHVPSGSTGEQPANVTRTDGAGRGSRSRSLDAIFEVLTAERRREALYVLYSRDEPISLTELAEEVASAEGSDVEQVAPTLYHVHLPKLADVGVVRYDPEAGIVRLADPSKRFFQFLRIAAVDEGRLPDSDDEFVVSDYQSVGSDDADLRESKS